MKRLLDLGCGFGHWSIVLAKAGFKVKAVDVSGAALKIVKQWAIQEKISIRTSKCVAAEIGTERIKYDAVICNSVLDHLPVADALKTVTSIRKILKYKGVAYIMFDGPEKIDKREFRELHDGTVICKKGKNKGMLWRYYTSDEILNLCREFEIVDYLETKNGRRAVWLRNMLCR